MNKKLWLSVLYNSSIIFTALCIFCTLIFTILFRLTDGTRMLPAIGVNFLLLLIAYIIALIIAFIVYKLKKPYVIERLNFIYLSATLFTYIFLVLNLSTVILKGIWCEETIFSILATSILTAVIKFFLKIPYFIKVTLNFVLFGIPFFVISVFLGEFGKENKIMILIFVYILIFAIVTAVISVIKAISKKHENDFSEYSKMFK